MVKRLLFLAIIGIASILLTGPSAHAADSLQLINVTPSSTALSVDPGASVKGSVDVINLGKNPFNVTMLTTPYQVAGLSYDPSFKQLPGTVNPSEWIHFTTATKNTLAAQKLSTVEYTVDVPKGTAPGGYYAVIFAQMDSVSTTTGVTTHSRVGDILYITVNGAVKKQGTASAPKIPSVITHTPVALKTIVSNEGGVHFQTNVTTNVNNLFNKTIFSHTANAYVLPQTERQLSTDWSPTAPLGIYRIERDVTLPNGTTTLPAQWVLVMKPWVIIVLIVMIIVIVSLVLQGIQKNGRKRRET